LEAAGGGLFADYFPAAEANETKDASPEEELTAIIAATGVRWIIGAQLANQHRRKGYFRSLHFMGCKNVVRWPGATSRSKAKTHDGRLDFVAVRKHEREIFIKHVDAHLAGRKARVPLTPYKFASSLLRRHRARCI